MNAMSANYLFNKEILEKYLGYEINNFKQEPVIVNDEVIGINLIVEPKSRLEYINIDINISPTGTVELK